MQSYKKFLLAAAATLVFSANAMAAEKLKMGIEAAYPPFNNKDASGQVVGFDKDIGDALCAKMKVDCSVVTSDWDGIIPALNAKKFDFLVSSLSITDERKKSVDFTGKYYHTPAKLAMKAGTEIKDPLVDLKGKKVGVQRASIYDRYATEVFAPAGVEVVRYSSQNEIFLDLTAGRLDATLADVVNIDDGFLKTDAGKGFALVGPDYTDEKYFGNGAGIAVRKGDKALADKISAAILAIRANGKYKEVQDKYFQFNVYGE